MTPTVAPRIDASQSGRPAASQNAVTAKVAPTNTEITRMDHKPTFPARPSRPTNGGSLRIALGLALGFLLGVAGSVYAARNGAGTYSLPAGNPVVAGTPISSTVHNATMADLAAEVTSSLDRAGRGGMTAPLKLSDGVVGAPGLAFTSEATSGLYRAAANDVGLSVAGTRIQRWQAGGTTVTGTLGVSGNATVGGTLTATGGVTGVGALGTTNTWTQTNTFPAVIATGGLSTISGYSPASPGDAWISRAAAPTQGFMYLGSGGSAYLAYDGAGRYHLPNFPLEIAAPTAATDAATKGYVDGYVIRAHLNSGGGLARGSAGVTASVLGVGSYRVSHASISGATSVATATAGHSQRRAIVSGYGPGYVDVAVFESNSLATAAEGAVSVIVIP